MPAVQTVYKKRFDRYVEGMIPSGELKNLISKQVEGNDGVGFGKAVKHGSANGTCAAATASGDAVIGITTRDMSVDISAVDTFKKDSDALILEKGPIVVTAAIAVARGAKVYMVVGTANAGKFTSASSSNLEIPRAVFDETTTAVDQLVFVRIS